MQHLPEGIDPEIWSQIQETFNKIKEEAGVEPEEDYMAELEELLGMSVDEMNEGHMKMIKTKTVGVELVHDDAKFPTYAYPSDSGFGTSMLSRSSSASKVFIKLLPLMSMSAFLPLRLSIPD